MHLLKKTPVAALALLAGAALAGCGGSGGTTPSTPESIKPPVVPTSAPTSAPQAIKMSKATFLVRVAKPLAKGSTLLKPLWISPSSNLLVLDVASINGVSLTAFQSYTQSQPLTGSNCTADPNYPGFAVDCTVTFTNVPVGNVVFRATTTDNSSSAVSSAPANIQPVAADGTTKLGPALSQNFIAASIAAGGTSNCNASAPPLVNCIAGTLDGVVYGYYPIGFDSTISAPVPSPVPSGVGALAYIIYTGFKDYDGNNIVGGGAGNLDLGDTAVYTPVGWPSPPSAEALDTLTVSSSDSASPVILTNASSNGLSPTMLLGHGASVATTKINEYQYVAPLPTATNPTSLCESDTAGVIPANTCTTFSPVVGSVGGSLN